MKTIPNYIPFQYQKDTISNIIEIVDINNGACIFDETGLGKTITSLTAAINLGSSILVISPVANKNAWIKVANNLTDINIDISTIQSFSKLEPKKYDVIIVDEAHNFRNIKNKTYIDLFLTIQKNKAKTLLLTATPFNNNFSELKAMLSLILFHNDTEPFYVLSPLLNSIIENEKKYLISKDKPNNYGNEVKFYTSLHQDLARFKAVLATFIVRNTRDYIKTNYASDIAKMGLFPNINSENINVENNNGGKISVTLDIIKKAPLARQNVISYLNPNNTNSDFTGLYKTLLMKRLDSSVYAFVQTITNSLIELEKLSAEKIYRLDNETIEMPVDFWNDVETDISLFKQLLEIWKDVTDTFKTDILVKHVSEMVARKEKVVVFTEYNDTLDVISKALSGFRVIKYNAKSSEKELEKIVYDFDANIDISDMKNNFDVLICTDVLSEGVNLHRASNVLDYDSKWNPSRLKQRHGRVDRIDINNSNTKSINIKRFGTDTLVESIIKLEDKIKRKTNYFDILTDIVYTPNTYRNPNFVNGKILGYINNNFNSHSICIRNKSYDFIIDNSVIDMFSRNDISDCQFAGYVVSNNVTNIFRYLEKNQYSHMFSKYSKSVYFHNRLYFDIYFNIMKDGKNKIDTEKLETVSEMVNNIDCKEIESAIIYVSKTGTLYVGETI